MPRHQAASRPLAFTRVRAVLAGALVLGVGGTMTFASWTDTEFGTASFSASIFDTESSADGGAWASNIAAPGATFTASSGMSPLVSKYTTLDLRTTAASTVGGTITLATAAKSGTLADVLEYRIVRVASATTCAAGVFTAGATYIAGDFTTYIAGGAMPGSTPGSTITSPSGAFRYCFEVRIKSGTANSYQGSTGSLTWSFTGISS